MQILKIVFAFLAEGGTSYAIFNVQQDRSAWVKFLSFTMANK